MKNKLAVVTFAILSVLAVSASCKKNSPDPEPTPVITYTVEAYYDFNMFRSNGGDAATVSKMLDFYQKKGFIKSHSGTASSATPVTLSKTGVAAADTAAVLAALRKELKEKLTNAAKEITSNDWSKTFGVDSFRLGYINLRAITETGEDIDASSFCAIPSLEYGKEYATGDATQPLQKFTITEEVDSAPSRRVGKATIKGRGEVKVIAELQVKGRVQIYVAESTSDMDNYALYFDKPGSNKDMTLKYRRISDKRDTVSVKYTLK